jgi:hypothetical protein
MWSIRNHQTGEVIELIRDVCTEHPEWVHQQCGTESESELQHMLDQMSSEDYAKGQDGFGIGFHADPATI